MTSRLMSFPSMVLNSRSSRNGLSPRMRIVSHLDIDQLGVEGVPVVEHGRKEVDGAGLVGAVFDAPLAEQAPLDGAHTDFGRAGGRGRRVVKQNGSIRN